MTAPDQARAAEAAFAHFEAAARRLGPMAALLGAATLGIVMMRIFGPQSETRQGLGLGLPVIAGAGLQLMLTWGPLAPVAERFRRLVPLKGLAGAAGRKGAPDSAMQRAFLRAAIWEAGIVFVLLSAMLTIFVAPPEMSGVAPERAPLYAAAAVLWFLAAIKPLFFDILFRLPAARALASGGSSSTGA